MTTDDEKDSITLAGAVAIGTRVRTGAGIAALARFAVLAAFAARKWQSDLLIGVADIAGTARMFLFVGYSSHNHL